MNTNVVIISVTLAPAGDGQWTPRQPEQELIDNALKHGFHLAAVSTRPEGLLYHMARRPPGHP